MSKGKAFGRGFGGRKQRPVIKPTQLADSLGEWSNQDLIAGLGLINSEFLKRGARVEMFDPQIRDAENRDLVTQEQEKMSELAKIADYRGQFIHFLYQAYFNAQQLVLLADLILNFIGGQALPQVAAEVEADLQTLVKSEYLKDGLQDFFGGDNSLLTALELRLNAIRRAKAGKTYNAYTNQVKQERGELWVRILQFVEGSITGRDTEEHTRLIAKLSNAREGEEWRERAYNIHDDLQLLSDGTPGRNEALNYLDMSYQDFWAAPNSENGKVQFERLRTYLRITTNRFYPKEG